MLLGLPIRDRGQRFRQLHVERALLGGIESDEVRVGRLDRRRAPRRPARRGRSNVDRCVPALDAVDGVEDGSLDDRRNAGHHERARRRDRVVSRLEHDPVPVGDLVGPDGRREGAGRGRQQDEETRRTSS